jgi:hypothetical protein
LLFSERKRIIDAAGLPPYTPHTITARKLSETLAR